MPLPERILIDTSAFYALISASDEFHDRARRAYESLIDRGQELFTTSYLLAESAALVHRRLGIEPLRLLSQAVLGNVGIFWVESSIHQEAWRLLLQGSGRGFGFVDWTTFLAAQRLRAHVFTFDHDFVQAGAAVIPA